MRSVKEIDGNGGGGGGDGGGDGGGGDDGGGGGGGGWAQFITTRALLPVHARWYAAWLR